ncbi:hypothetical protein CROQUDRAFT_107581 [Cronartium quercuum f. sp. fusiforme G11]|uniref:Uncharacterized protein n=1 Tax=Cronartium quercuum f. sp. fusiforme G11 TaxID=708437 RepID=A0A9P6NK96_9BASI|nr:hypothetical protein CROQUDRAFT_107581 [Cronartium quercuum f. sp. fusiforme G11]
MTERIIIADCAVTCHMSGNRYLFMSLEPIPPVDFNSAFKAGQPSTHFGIMAVPGHVLESNISTNIMVPGTLIFQSLPVTHLSLHQLATDGCLKIEKRCEHLELWQLGKIGSQKSEKEGCQQISKAVRQRTPRGQFQVSAWSVVGVNLLRGQPRPPWSSPRTSTGWTRAVKKPVGPPAEDPVQLRQPQHGTNTGWVRRATTDSL